MRARARRWVFALLNAHVPALAHRLIAQLTPQSGGFQRRSLKQTAPSATCHPSPPARPPRHNHVTPTSYLTLLSTFMRLLGERRAATTAAKRRLEVGLQKLTTTGEQARACARPSCSHSRFPQQPSQVHDSYDWRAHTHTHLPTP